MTFFNKKTEVMQIELTPYGRYLYSVGKFKPHSYEFVDDDVVYSVSGENQKDAHGRIINDTPKLKINRAFQDEAPQIESPLNTVDSKRRMVKTMNQKQNGLYCLGKSSYSSENVPSFQVTMLRGQISGSELYYETSSSSGQIGTFLIPQVEVDMNFIAISENVLNPPTDFTGESSRSRTFDDGGYVEVRYVQPIIHLKEFNSFYEKENFEFEVFKVTGDNGETLIPLKMEKKISAIVNDFLVADGDMMDLEPSSGRLFEEDRDKPDFMEYFFSIQVDTEIPEEELCKAVDSLEINSQFLDEELICPDQRSDRFDIYATRVGPDDLEDCD
jgi:hypothetical protein